MNKNYHLLLTALSISICIHLGAIYFYWPATTNADWIKPGQIEVSMASSISSSKINKNSSVKTNPKLKSVKAEKIYADEVPAKHQSQHSQSNTISAAKLNIQLRGKLRTALQEHLVYPALARRRGWQGTVTINLTVKESGDLQHVRLGKSSGYSLLDNSALSALQKVGRLTELKTFLNGKTIPIELPVKYILQQAASYAPAT